MGGYRDEAHCLQGFNLVVIDVDHGISLDTAKSLLKGYKALYYTTKRHTDTENRFRIVFPTSHVVKLNAEDYKKFMNNIYDWLPFEVDRQTNQRSRKWLTHNGHYEYSDGDLLDVMLFIPQTKKQEEQQKKILDHSSMSNLERWCLLNAEEGNRNNQMLRLGLAMVDAGHSLQDIKNSLSAFNDKLTESLTDEEIERTILVTVIKAVNKRDSI